MIATNATAGHALTSGVNPQGLGRWSWIRLTGKTVTLQELLWHIVPLKIQSHPDGTRNKYRACYSRVYKAALDVNSGWI